MIDNDDEKAIAFVSDAEKQKAFDEANAKVMEILKKRAELRRNRMASSQDMESKKDEQCLD